METLEERRLPDAVFTLGDVVDLPPPPRGRKFGDLIVYSVADARTASRRDYLVKGLLHLGDMSVLYGEPGCGKTFLAQHIAFQIGLGQRVLGQRVKATPTAVLYLALEGEGGFHDRVRGFAHEYGEPKGFHYLAQSINFFSNDAAVGQVIDAASNLKANLIIIDTLARAMAEGDENNSADMGKLIAVSDRIRAETGAHVMLVHHTGKDESRGMRGHSSLNGAADLVMKIKTNAETGERTIEVMKNKNGPGGASFGFKLRPVLLGQDDDGDAVTTMVLDELVAPPTSLKERRLTAKQQNALDEIASCVADLNPEPLSPKPDMPKVRAVPRREVLEHFRRKGLLSVRDEGDQNPHARKKQLAADRRQLQDRLEGLKAAHKVEFTSELVWLLNR